MSPARIHQHPLAYLVGLEGLALLRAFAGEHDREFALARLDEIRRLLDADLGEGIEATPASVEEVYAQWAPFYDEPGNAMIDAEQPVVREILAPLPAGDALDAACGTGRHAEFLAAQGHRVTGVDASPEMLAVARRKLPQVAFVEAELEALPFPDASFDVVVCALALQHVADLGVALAELARVLRPGGHLVVSDSRGHLGEIGFPHVRRRADGSVGYLPNRMWTTCEYLEAALPLGLQVRRCSEPRRMRPIVTADGRDGDDGSPSPEHVPGGIPVIWALHPYAIEAANAAWAGQPIVVVWHFQR